jgi:hypothetical protein
MGLRAVNLAPELRLGRDYPYEVRASSSLPRAEACLTRCFCGCHDSSAVERCILMYVWTVIRNACVFTRAYIRMYVCMCINSCEFRHVHTLNCEHVDSTHVLTVPMQACMSSTKCANNTHTQYASCLAGSPLRIMMNT